MLSHPAGDGHARDPRAGPRAWGVLAGVLAAGAACASLTVADHPAWGPALDWQPGHDLVEPWRAWTAALVHRTPAHLLGNLVATALVAVLGVRARAEPRDALAWTLAWPATQAGLDVVARLAPDEIARALPHYNGLSGVLHAGVVVLALTLVTRGPAVAPRRERLVGLALLTGVGAKLLVESPWHLVPRAVDPSLGIAVAPAGHAAGVVAGALAWAATRALRASRA